ncbi:DUF2798 domain-containing protein [Eubacterium ramulus]
MPKTKLQNVFFTILMVAVMVYGMVCYNVALAQGEMTNQVFILALGELPIMGVIAFVVELLFVERIVKRIAFQCVDPQNIPQILLIILISSLTVAFMCPIMSFFASILFGFKGTGMLLGNWLQTAARNFPMALFWQLFYAGPFVRFVFRKAGKIAEKRNDKVHNQEIIC